jgi:hypothetical protein
MPCYDSRDEPDYVRKEARDEFRHNSDVAEMLCKILTLYPEATYTTEEIQNWWKEHQERDRNRKS